MDTVTQWTLILGGALCLRFLLSKGFGGAVALVAGIAGLILAYTYRPPSALGDYVAMAMQGREFYLKEPYFVGAMAISGLLVVVGIRSLFRRRSLAQMSSYSSAQPTRAMDHQK